MLKTINSFDIFDTLIGRICGEPDGVFDAVANKIKYPNFKYIRKLSESKSNGLWDNIWEEFKKLSGLFESEIDEIKNIEWNIEQEYTFPIKINSSLLTEKDILISDMYLTQSMIKELLQKNNISKYDKLYVSPNGKRSGKIWNIVKNDGYDIRLHTGDNMDSDILSAKKHNIRTSFFDKDYSDKEKFFLKYNKNVANLLRILRLNNNYYTLDVNLSIKWNILSNIYPIYSIVFNSSNKQYYIDHFLEHYQDYSNHLDSYTDNIELIKTMQNLTESYLFKLKLDIDSISCNKTMISEYITKNCILYPKDNLKNL